jgi:hypothetical protein
VLVLSLRRTSNLRISVPKTNALLLIGSASLSQSAQVELIGGCLCIGTASLSASSLDHWQSSSISVASLEHRAVYAFTGLSAIMPDQGTQTAESNMRLRYVSPLGWMFILTFPVVLFGLALLLLKPQTANTTNMTATKPVTLPLALQSLSMSNTPPTNAASAHDTVADIHCGRTWPIEGAWNSSTFAPSNCNGQALPQEQMLRCLRRRKVFALGNSIMRQFAFELPSYLFKEPTQPRWEQKQVCPKEGSQPTLCSIHSTDGSVVVHDAWFLYLNGKPPYARADTQGGAQWERDTCGERSARDCLEQLLANSTTSDVLLVNPGIIYGISDPVGVPNVWKWRESEARAFISTVRAAFRGTVVWMTVTPMQSAEHGFSCPNRYLQERSDRFNEEIMPVILAAAPDWYVIDAANIMLPVLYKPGFYSD